MDPRGRADSCVAQLERAGRLTHLADQLLVGELGEERLDAGSGQVEAGRESVDGEARFVFEPEQEPGRPRAELELRGLRDVLVDAVAVLAAGEAAESCLELFERCRVTR